MCMWQKFPLASGHGHLGCVGDGCVGGGHDMGRLTLGNLAL